MLKIEKFWRGTSSETNIQKPQKIVAGKQTAKSVKLYSKARRPQSPSITTQKSHMSDYNNHTSYDKICEALTQKVSFETDHQKMQKVTDCVKICESRPNPKRAA